MNVSEKVVRLRLMGCDERLEALADELVGVVEAAGYECIEQTRPYPCRPPDEGISKLFLTFVARGETDDRSHEAGL